MEDVFLSTFQTFFCFALIISVNLVAIFRIMQTGRKVHLLDKIHYQWRDGTILRHSEPGGLGRDLSLQPLF